LKLGILKTNGEFSRIIIRRVVLDVI